MPFQKGHLQYNTGKTHFKKGHIPWSKGKKLSEEHRKKLSEANKGHTPWSKKGLKGIRLSPKTEFKKGHIPWNKGLKGLKPYHNVEGLKKGRGYWRGKHQPKISGKNHWNWQGGITGEGVKIRVSLEYKIWRRNVFKRDDYTCQICGKKGGELHADHIKSFALYPELRFDINNGRTLCVKCHKKTDSYMNNKLRKIKR